MLLLNSLPPCLLEMHVVILSSPKSVVPWGCGTQKVCFSLQIPITGSASKGFSLLQLMLIAGTCSLIRAALEGYLCVRVGTDSPDHQPGQGGFLGRCEQGYLQLINF